MAEPDGLEIIGKERASQKGEETALPEEGEDGCGQVGGGEGHEDPGVDEGEEGGF